MHTKYILKNMHFGQNQTENLKKEGGAMILGRFEFIRTKVFQICGLKCATEVAPTDINSLAGSTPLKYELLSLREVNGAGRINKIKDRTISDVVRCHGSSLFQPSSPLNF